MSIYSISCPTIGCYQNFTCDPEYLNKIIAVAFVKKSAASTINKSNPADWLLSLRLAQLNGNAQIIYNTSGEKPKPETATTAGRGMQNTKTLAKTHTVTIQDMQGVIRENVEFYNNMLQYSQNYDFYYFTPSRIWDASGYYVTVVGDPIITSELNTYQMADVTITWVSKTNPLPYDFDTDDLLQGLYYEISVEGDGAANWGDFKWATFDCQSFSPNLSYSLNVNVDGQPAVKWMFGSDVTLLSPFEGVPTNFNNTNPPLLTINTDTGIVTVTPDNDVLGNGEATFTVMCQSANGCVFGSQLVELTIQGCQGS
jgi:hypothetical protein